MSITADQLVGTWEYVEYWVTTDDGEISHPFGPDATGFIIYTPDGFMSLQVMRAGRPAYGSGDVHAGSEAEMAAAAAGYLVYSGPFSFDEATSVVKHEMNVSLYPN